MTLPITVRGVRYPSISAAARALGVTISAVYRAYYGNRLDLIGTRTSRRGPEPITVNGVTYVSLAEAARATGWHRITLSRRREQFGNSITLQPKSKKSERNHQAFAAALEAAA